MFTVIDFEVSGLKSNLLKPLFAILACTLLMFAGRAAVEAQTAPVTAASCPAGTTFVKGYTKANGTAVAPYCKTSKKKTTAGAMSAAPDATTAPAAMATAASAMATAAPAITKKTTAASTKSSSKMTSSVPVTASTTCPEGKSYVHGYTTKKGTQVAGYCRKARAKKSS